MSLSTKKRLQWHNKYSPAAGEFTAQGPEQRCFELMKLPVYTSIYKLWIWYQILYLLKPLALCCSSHSAVMTGCEEELCGPKVPMALGFAVSAIGHTEVHDSVMFLCACACWDHLLHLGSCSCQSAPAPCAQTQPGDFFLPFLLHQPFLWREDGSHNLLQGWCSGQALKSTPSFPSGTNVSSLRFSIWQGSSSPKVTPDLSSPFLNYLIKWASQPKIMFPHYVKLSVAFKDDFMAFILVMDIILCLMQETS